MQINIRADDMLVHNEDVGGVLHKYDLPTVNTPITFRNQNALLDMEEAKLKELTATEQLLTELECDKDTAYESFIIKMQQNYNNEVDMYGDIRQAGDC